MKSLINDLAMFKNLTTTLYMDNLSAIKLIKNPEFHRRSKHIDVCYLMYAILYRDKFNKKEILLQYIAFEDQQVDLLTKPA